jgi:hypothetical protein
MNPALGCSDPSFKLTAEAMLRSVRAVMDEYALEIFDRWFNGKTTGEVTFNTPKWAAYMRADKRLPRQIEDQLRVHADCLRDRVERSPNHLVDRLQLSFHAEVGSESGGYRTGYNVLHGSNRDVGDFGITGRFTAVRSGAPGSAYTVTYDDLEFVFNDIVDVNKRWAADAVFGRTAANLARCLGTGPPKDYTLRIKWKAVAPMTIMVGAQVKGQPPSWLKQFPNTK